MGSHPPYELFFAPDLVMFLAATCLSMKVSTILLTGMYWSLLSSFSISFCWITPSFSFLIKRGTVFLLLYLGYQYLEGTLFILMYPETSNINSVYNGYLPNILYNFVFLYSLYKAFQLCGESDSIIPHKCRMSDIGYDWIKFDYDWIKFVHCLFEKIACINVWHFLSNKSMCHAIDGQKHLTIS